MSRSSFLVVEFAICQKRAKPEEVEGQFALFVDCIQKIVRLLRRRITSSSKGATKSFTNTHFTTFDIVTDLLVRPHLLHSSSLDPTMTTMIEESFNKRCNVSSNRDAAQYYGYDDLGYGNGAPDVAKYVAEPDANNEDYGYGDGAPDLGYGDATPDSAKAASVDYGYGDASPDLGYGDGAPDSAGSSDPNADKSNAPEEGDQPKRTRRRNSVTRYSIVAQEEVKTEFQAHADMINQFRNGGAGGEVQIPLKDSSSTPATSAMSSRSSHSQSSQHSDDGMSYDGTPSDDGLDASEKKKKRGGLGSRWRIGRNSSNVSKN